MYWLLVGLFLFVVCLICLFAAVGVLYLTRGTPVRRVRAPGDEEGPPEANDPQFQATVALLTKTELRGGHSVAVMTCGDELYPRLWDDLRGARRSITLQLYYCQPGRMADELAEIVIERARAGVQVLFLRDAFGSAKLTQEYLDRLEAGGVRMAVFRPTRPWELHKVQHRSHIRVVVVDGRVGYTGGFGLDDKWFGDGRHRDQWRDTTARFTGPSVNQLQATFAAGWAEATGVLLTGDHFFAMDDDGEFDPTRAGDDVCAGLLHCSPTLGSTPAERFMALSISGARRRLWISNSYFVPDDHFCGMLALAVKRGVDVRVLAPDRANADVPVTYFAGRHQYDRLLRAGVRLWEYSASMMHAKTLVVDGVWTSIGTNNFDNRSMAFNDETVLMTHQSSVARRMEEIFEADLGHATEVTRDAFDRRPWRDRLYERAASTVSRIL